MKRQQKSIDKLLIEGEEVLDGDQIKEALIRHLKLQYKKQEVTSFDISIIGLLKLTQECSKRLEEHVTI